MRIQREVEAVLDQLGVSASASRRLIDSRRLLPTMTPTGFWAWL